jgi:hypothetical protein
MLLHVNIYFSENFYFGFITLALARTIQAKKRRPKNAGKPRPPRDLIQKKM